MLFYLHKTSRVSITILTYRWAQGSVSCDRVNIPTCLGVKVCLSVHITLKPGRFPFSYLCFPLFAKSSHSVHKQMSSQEWGHGCTQLRCMPWPLCSQRGKDVCPLRAQHGKLLERESVGQQGSCALLLPISLTKKMGTAIGLDWVSCPLLWTRKICFQKRSERDSHETSQSEINLSQLT